MIRSIPFPGRSARPDESTQGKASAPASGNVISLVAARNRLQLRRQAAVRADTTPEKFEQLELEGLDFDRLTPGARQLYWFNLNNYARHLFAAASDAAANDSGYGYAPVTTEHLREAERRRLGAVRRRDAFLGAGFLLDALQILGAATCGALATRPNIVEGFGPLPLVAALAATISIFLLREFLYAGAEA